MKNTELNQHKNKTIWSLIFFIAGLFFHNSTFSQQSKIDSLQNLLNVTQADTTKARLLNAIARLVINSDTKQAKLFVEKAVLISQKINSFSQNLAYSYNLLGIIDFYESNYQQSLKNHSIALTIRTKILDKKGIAASYNNMALVYRSQGKYKEAIKNQFLALKIEETLNDKEGVGISYNNIGIIYEEQNDFKSAIKNYQLAIKFGEITNDKEGVANAYNNLGIVYKKQSNYDSALVNYEKALVIRKELNYKKAILGSYNNIGSLYLAKGNYSKALDYNFLSLKIAEETQSEELTAISFINIGLVYSKQHKFDKAKLNLNKGLEYATKIKNKQYIMECCSSLAELYTTIGDYKNALSFFKVHQNYKDSLLSDNNKQEIMKSAIQFEFEKKEAIYKIERDKKETIQRTLLERKNTQIKLYIAISVIVMMLFVGIIFQMRNTRKTEKLKLEKNLIDLEQKALRLQMNPHFIFNALNSIQGFITENNIINAKKYLTKFAKLMRLILENSTEAVISLENEKDVLINYLELTQLRFSNSFDFKIDIDATIDTLNTEIPPMLLQPFVENAVLHGISSKTSKGHISICFKQNKNSIICTIEDDGIGRQQASLQKNASHKSTGMMVTEERLKEFGKKSNQIATVTIVDLIDKFDKPCGTKVILEIPIQLSWA